MSTALLLLLLPLYALIALLIRLDSPVLFTQRRVGSGGAEFAFLKFRSMYADAERRLDGLLAQSERSGPVLQDAGRPRITRVGRLLRRASLDELPQLLNVLRGEMSLVGPRPARSPSIPSISATARQRRRLCFTPGLAGLWQVSGRAAVSFERSVETDAYYTSRTSRWDSTPISSCSPSPPSSPARAPTAAAQSTPRGTWHGICTRSASACARGLGTVFAPKEPRRRAERGSG